VRKVIISLMLKLVAKLVSIAYKEVADNLGDVLLNEKRIVLEEYRGRLDW
jgi:hypothetical protein